MEDESSLWCATIVDGNRVYNGDHNFGWCSSTCEETKIMQNVQHASCNQCRFPFKYQGVDYNECTMKDERYLWCATDVDVNGEYNGNFGWCSSSCAAPPQQNNDQNTISCDQCQFPFKYKGVEYNECTMEDESELWCATQVDNNREYITFGWCKSTCTSGERTNGHQGSKTDNSNPCPNPNSYYNEFVQRCECLPGYARDREDDNRCKCIEGEGLPDISRRC